MSTSFPVCLSVRGMDAALDAGLSLDDLHSTSRLNRKAPLFGFAVKSTAMD